MQARCCSETLAKARRTSATPPFPQSSVIQSLNSTLESHYQLHLGDHRQTGQTNLE